MRQAVLNNAFPRLKQVVPEDEAHLTESTTTNSDGARRTASGEKNLIQTPRESALGLWQDKAIAAFLISSYLFFVSR